MKYEPIDGFVTHVQFTLISNPKPTSSQVPAAFRMPLVSSVESTFYRLLSGRPGARHDRRQRRGGSGATDRVGGRGGAGRA